MPERKTRRQQEAAERAAKRRMHAAVGAERRRAEDALLEAEIARGERVPAPWRITNALDQMGAYGPQVNRDLGVREPRVDEWEAGLVVPTLDEVKRLADYTGYQWRWFYARGEQPVIGMAFFCGPGQRGAVDLAAEDAQRRAERLDFIKLTHACGEQLAMEEADA